MKFVLSVKGMVLIVVAVAVAEALILNPIHFHQVARSGEYTMRVPMFWTPVKDPGVGTTAAYQHEWPRLVGQASVAIMDRRTADEAAAPWTAEDARKQLAFLGVMQSRNKDYTDPRLFNLGEGKYSSMCQESTVKGNQAMLCFVVGTPLQFSYLGSRKYEPVAQKMLATLE